ncbi:MAG: TIGR02117 family protein [Pseudomonadota bacterium]
MVVRLKRFARWTGLTLLGLIFAFLLSAWIGSSIPRNGDWDEPDDGVTILVGHNGIHTEIIMPITTEAVDWRAHFPMTDIDDSSRDYTHVGVSWGERSFFLETPTWADLSLLTAIGALTGGDGLIHAAYYVRPAPAADFRELTIRPEEYRKLIDQVTRDLVPPEDRKTYGGYSTHDVFYDARGTYHLGNTCNQWTSDRLSAAGIETGLWTPLPGGVMKWVPRPSAS